MRRVVVLATMLTAGALATGVAALRPAPNPLLATAGAGVLGAGVVGLVADSVDVRVARDDLDSLVVLVGAGALFARVALLNWAVLFDWVAWPLRLDVAALTAAAGVTVGLVAGFRGGEGSLDGLRHGLLACGLGGVLCVLVVAYNAARLGDVGSFDVVVASSGIVLPVCFGGAGGAFGAVGGGVAAWVSNLEFPW